MIKEVLDHIIDTHLDEDNPNNLSFNGCELVQIRLGQETMASFLSELEAMLPPGTTITSVDTYRGISIESITGNYKISPVYNYEIKKP